MVQYFDNKIVFRKDDYHIILFHLYLTSYYFKQISTITTQQYLNGCLSPQYIIIFHSYQALTLYPSSKIGLLTRTLKVQRFLGLNINYHHSLYFLNGNDRRELNMTQCLKINSIVKQGNFKTSCLLYNDIEAIRKQRMWSQKLSWIKPFYAIKANPSTPILQDFKKQKSGFDCASKNEIKQILALGVSPNLIVYSNPVKDEDDLQWAYQHGIKLTTADSYDELLKIKQFAPNIDVLWRISIKQDASDNLATTFSGKFGDDIETNQEIHHRMKCIQQMGIKLKGIHFHCGSGHHGSSGFSKAVLLARNCLKIGRQYDHQMNLLDIGGGFPNADLSQNIIDALKMTKNDPLKYDIIAQPGRHMCSNAFYLLTKVLGKRIKNGKICYHLNESLYHSFNCNLMDGSSLQKEENTFYARIDQKQNSFINIEEQKKSILFGMTCDGMDIISNSINVPTSVEVGDWICISGMGAYTYGCRSKFNGMSSTEKIIKFSTNIGEISEQIVQRKSKKQILQPEINLPYQMLVI